MLLVVFGAGASYDSVLHLPPPPPDWITVTSTRRVQQYGLHEEFRPPLANQLFDDRPSFVKVMQDYAACKPLVNLLRGDIQVERQLAKFEEEGKTFPARNRQLAAIRYYLHEMLWNCQDNWRLQHRGITNYLTFVDAIDRWLDENKEKVCFVTFNYDTMLEDSLAELWGVKFGDLSTYTRHDHFKLIKLHGSIDWGLELNTNLVGSLPGAIIDAALRRIDVSERYQKVARPPVIFEARTYGFPALAIPVEKKREFNCPKDHLQALANVLPRVTKMITIGWRATEQHFLDMLKNRLSGLPGDVDLLTVSGTPGGARDTVNNLAIDNSKGLKRELHANGFSGLIRDIHRLEAFLRA